jgi:hypothetical protein
MKSDDGRNIKRWALALAVFMAGNLLLYGHVSTIWLLIAMVAIPPTLCLYDRLILASRGRKG